MGGEAKCPLTGGCWEQGRGSKDHGYPGPGSGISPEIFLAHFTPGSWDPKQTNSLSKDGVLWLGWVPSPLPTKGQGPRILTKELAKAISLYFSFLPLHRFAEAEDEWVLEGKGEHLCPPPRPQKIVFAHC